ncbi:MAG TPA: DUF302 domain-containing protein [Alphaproteobacteria bacterium]|jgi:uncharacterized protein (DUF302 family)
MFARIATLIAAGLIIGMMTPPPATTLADSPKAVPAANGIVKLKSAYGMEETIARLKADIAKKGITFFAQIDQDKLAAAANIKIGPSVLLIFGNPALGTQFMTRNPEAGIDWPVRILVYRDGAGQVFAEYTDFLWIARRHGIVSDDAPFKMANEVIGSITSSVAK